MRVIKKTFVPTKNSSRKTKVLRLFLFRQKNFIEGT